MRMKIKYVTVSIPKAMADDIDELMEQHGYWPSRGAFVREAIRAKIEEERVKLQSNHQREA